MKILGWTLIISVLAVPVLIVASFYKWLRSRAGLPAWRGFLGISGTVLLLSAWTLFVVGAFRGWVGGFGSHLMTRLDVSNLGLALSAMALVCAFFLRGASRVFGILPAIITFLLWGGSQLVA